MSQKLYLRDTLSLGASDLVYASKSDGSSDGKASLTAMSAIFASTLSTTFQPLSTNLTTYAGIAPSANVQTLLGAADYAAFRTSLGIGAIGLLSTVAEANITLADNTTGNVSITKHGFAPKAPNDATLYLDGTGAYSTPAGSGGLPTQTGNSGKYLTTNGTAASWSAVDLSTASVTGTLTVNKGGTGAATLAAHGVLIGNGTSAVAVTSAGTAGQVLTSNGASADPTFQQPALVLITETTTSGTATDVTFSSIATTYRDLEIRVRGRGTTAATTTALKMQFNGDTASNYDTQYVAGVGAAASALSAGATAFINTGDLVAASGTSGFPSAIDIVIYDYRGTTFQKVTKSTSAAKWTNTANNTEAILLAGFWRSASAINAVKIFPTAGAFVDGTVVSLYGRM